MGIFLLLESTRTEYINLTSLDQRWILSGGPQRKTSERGNWLARPRAETPPWTTLSCWREDGRHSIEPHVAWIKHAAKSAASTPSFGENRSWQSWSWYPVTTPCRF